MPYYLSHKLFLLYYDLFTICNLSNYFFKRKSKSIVSSDIIPPITPNKPIDQTVSQITKQLTQANLYRNDQQRRAKNKQGNNLKQQNSIRSQRENVTQDSTTTSSSNSDSDTNT